MEEQCRQTYITMICQGRKSGHKVLIYLYFTQRKPTIVNLIKAGEFQKWTLWKRMLTSARTWESVPQLIDSSPIVKFSFGVHADTSHGCSACMAALDPHATEGCQCALTIIWHIFCSLQFLTTAIAANPSPECHCLYIAFNVKELER